MLYDTNNICYMILLKMFVSNTCKSFRIMKMFCLWSGLKNIKNMNKWKFKYSMLSILFIVFNLKLNYQFCYYFFIFARNELFCLVHTNFSGIDYFVSEVLVFLHSKAVRTWYLHLKHKLRPCCPTLWWRKEVICGGRRWGRSESRIPLATTHLMS